MIYQFPILYILFAIASSSQQKVKIRCTINDLNQMYLNVSIHEKINDTDSLHSYQLQKKLRWSAWEPMAACRTRYKNTLLSIKCQGWKRPTKSYYDLRIWNTNTKKEIKIMNVWNPYLKHFFCIDDHKPKIISISGEVKKLIVQWKTNIRDYTHIVRKSIEVIRINKTVRVTNITQSCAHPVGCFNTLKNLEDCTTYDVCVVSYFKYKYLTPPQRMCKQAKTYCSSPTKPKNMTIIVSSAMITSFIVLAGGFIVLIVYQHFKRRKAQKSNFTNYITPRKDHIYESIENLTLYDNKIVHL